MAGSSPSSPPRFVPCTFTAKTLRSALSSLDAAAGGVGGVLLCLHCRRLKKETRDSKPRFRG